MHIAAHFSGMRNVLVRVEIRAKAQNKENTMYEMIQYEDEMLNHYLNHFDECDTENIQFNAEYDCIEVTAELIEEILWS